MMKPAVILFLMLGFFSIASNGYTQSLMRNSNFILHQGNFNMSSGEASNDTYTTTFTAGQTAPGLYTGTNFKVRAGFQYYYSIIPFRFTISDISINFGTLTPGEPISRTSTLTISNGSAFGYQVTAYEDHALRVFTSGNDIPDTTCDSGTCSEATPATWSNALTYGFGFRCDNLSGTGCVSDFTTSGYYKQFANLESGETPQAVMSGQNVGRDITSQITYKVNISNSQAAGTYQNKVTYIATPTF